MEFLELTDELAERGFNYLSLTRRKSYINRAKDRLDNMYRWPYRETLATGVSPLAISDLGHVEFVKNATQNYTLYESNRKELTNWYGDITTAGGSYYWYRTNEAGVPTIATYPTNGDTLSVQHWQQTPTLVNDDDEPLAPSKYHLLYIDMAVQMAYRDADNHAGAESLWVEINRQVFEMIEDLLPQHGPMRQQITWGSDDS